MCGITGIVALSSNGTDFLPRVENAVDRLNRRGPDHSAVFRHHHVALGHARLSIIDTSAAANQPFTDVSGRYTVVFNGEIYNYRELRKELEADGIKFRSESDTEVLLELFIKEGESFLEKLNGFFALAIYDSKDGYLFLARDRMGIKPLLIYRDENKLIFASEMKAILAYGIRKEIDRASLFTYLQLNYIPAPATILRGVRKVMPGHKVMVTNLNAFDPEDLRMEEEAYYQIPYDPEFNIKITPDSYESAVLELQNLLEQAVTRRLVADVPLGTFLSGGIDSSVITTLAARHTRNLKSFSIGYADEPYFDETEFARLVAKKAGTDHTVFSLTNEDLFAHLREMLDYLDEPFADSSALAVYILSKKTRQEVTVALSGDGADEMFSGYHKHLAEFRARNAGVAENLVKGLAPVWKSLPQSRNTKLGNMNRQLNRFSEGMKLGPKDRYWRWATYLKEEEANYLLKEEMIFNLQRLSDDAFQYKKNRESLLKHLTKEGSINQVLLTDMNLVLPNDMLTKVDLMSMANSLEVRTPFLDHQVVGFAFRLPPPFKINSTIKKKILQDAFRKDLPEELYNRPKKGFEVPLLNWLQTDLKSMITDDLLEENFIAEQGLFNVKAVEELKSRLFSSNPGDAVATVWALVVFQHWWKNYFQTQD